LLPETIIRLASVSPICGVKEATGDLQRLETLLKAELKDFAIYSGDDATACDFILQGGQGDIAGTEKVVPAQMARMCELALKKDADAAKKIDGELRALHRLLFVESSPIPVKWALAEMQKMTNGIRLPLTSLAEENQSELRAALASCACV